MIHRGDLDILLQLQGGTVCLGEQSVNLFELQSLGLRIEEVNARNPAGIENSEDNISFPSNILDRS
jgi:hypothetical protein